MNQPDVRRQIFFEIQRIWSNENVKNNQYLTVCAEQLMFAFLQENI